MHAQGSRRRRRPIVGRTGLSGPAVLCVLVALTAACGDGSTPGTSAQVAPADLLLGPAALPTGYTPTQLSVGQLVDANAAGLRQAESASVVPQQCRPTADADLNHRLTEANTAVIGARSGTGTLVELVSSATRDLGADVTETTGVCARTETTINQGNLTGTRIVTVYTELPDPALGDAATEVEQMHVVQSVTTTTLPDSGVATRVAYSGHALVRAPGKVSAAAPFTVSLTVNGNSTDAVPPPAAAPQAQPPMTADDFVTLFGSAVTTAATAGAR